MNEFDDIDDFDEMENVIREIIYEEDTKKDRLESMKEALSDSRLIKFVEDENCYEEIKQLYDEVQEYERKYEEENDDDDDWSDNE